jgi:tetratricopeptide (TPR) repeat protein
VREQAGDFAGAEQILGSLLQRDPQSLTGLIALERVMRIENRVKELVPYAQMNVKTDPTSAIGNQMLVRALSSLNDVAALDRAADAWIKAVPKVETAYREIARVWQQRGDWTKALQYLELGRARVPQEDALALELGDAYAALQQPERAAREWERAIGPNAHGLLLVQRRLSAMKDGGAQVIRPLVDALAKPPTTFARRRAATQIAIDAGLSERAEQLVRSVAEELKGQEKQNFLVEMARKADASQLPRVALLAYSQIAMNSMNAEQTLAIRAHLAELALAVGDTANAARSYQALEQSLAVGSPQRRQAIALRIQLMVKEARLDDADRELASFRGEFPDAPELDAVASSIASAYLDKDDTERAENTLIGATGARSSIARGRIALRRGDVAAAKIALMSAAPTLQGSEATETIKLVTLLGKLSHEGGELLGKAMARAGAGATREAVTLLEKGTDQLPEAERPSVLDFAAAIADRGQLQLDGERLRRRIIIEYPASTEAPSALLALAHSLGDKGESLDEARQFFEKLILEYPRSALVPQARQELDRLQGRVPKS